MKLNRWIVRGAALTAMVWLLPWAAADDTNHPDDDALVAQTTPSHTAKPSFMEPGIIKQWLVKPDDIVKKGEVLAVEDTDLADLDLKAKQMDADSSTAQINADIAARDEKKSVYDSKVLAADATSATEVLQAKLDYDEADQRLVYDQAQQQVKQANITKEAKEIEKMKLLSPADGIVKSLNIQEGEPVDPNKPDGALTLVTNNPLWVDVKVPSAQALKLKQGDTVSVSYQNEPDSWANATVIFLDPEVDAASDKQTVRLELQNDQSRPAGLWVKVRLAPATGSTTDAGGH
jgi:RND family efflux transporter MFP subunit